MAMVEARCPPAEEPIIPISYLSLIHIFQKALHCVEENMENPEYSVEKLAADIGMTRMSLYRKLQSITGQDVYKRQWRTCH